MSRCASHSIVVSLSLPALPSHRYSSPIPVPHHHYYSNNNHSTGTDSDYSFVGA